MKSKISFNTIQYDIDLKHITYNKVTSGGFNTIQYDIDLKHAERICIYETCFNTIQYDIDLKPIKMYTKNTLEF